MNKNIPCFILIFFLSLSLSFSGRLLSPHTRCLGSQQGRFLGFAPCFQTFSKIPCPFGAGLRAGVGHVWPAGGRGGTSSTPGRRHKAEGDYLWNRFPPGCVTGMGVNGVDPSTGWVEGLGHPPTPKSRMSWGVWHWHSSDLEDVFYLLKKQLWCFLPKYFCGGFFFSMQTKKNPIFVAQGQTRLNPLLAAICPMGFFQGFGVISGAWWNYAVGYCKLTIF